MNYIPGLDGYPYVQKNSNKFLYAIRKRNRITINNILYTVIVHALASA